LKSAYLLRWLRHFKAATALTLTLAVVSLGLIFYWLNSHGFEGRWSQRIADELARRGIHADFESVRFSPTKGVIATNLKIFTDESRRTVTAKIPDLRLDVDRGKAFRGQLQIRRVYLENAELTIPVTADTPLQIDNLTGRLSVDRHDRLIIESTEGTFKGMNIQTNIALDNFDPDKLREGAGPDESSKRWVNFTEDLLRELDSWSFPDHSPPSLQLAVKGSFNRTAAIRTSISLSAPNLMRGRYRMQDVRLSGELGNRSLSVEELSFTDGVGKFSLQAHYDLEDKTGGYEGTSSIQIVDLLREGLEDDSLSEFSPEVAPQIRARGKFTLQKGTMDLSAIGSLSCKSFHFLGIPFESINTDFSWKNGDIYLRDLVVNHESGALAGEVKVKNDLVQYRTQTSLPLSVYRPFIGEQSGLERVLTESEFDDDSKILIDAHGSVWRKNLSDWDATGEFTLENFRHNGVPVKLATAGFSMSPLDYIFDDLKAVFDYRGNTEEISAERPGTGTVLVKQVHFDAKEKLTRVTKLEGTAWPGPILQLFNPLISKHVSETYRFREPPHLACTGVIDHLNPGHRTDIQTVIRANGDTDFDLLGRPIEISELSATIRTSYRKNEVSALNMNLFGGSVGGLITQQSHPNRLAIQIQGQGLEASQIGQTYRLSKIVPGTLTLSIAAQATEQEDNSGAGKWELNGACNVGQSVYNGVHIRNGATQFGFDPKGLHLTNTKLTFDYSDYVLRARHGGPLSAQLGIERLHYDPENGTTELVNLQGSAWPGPLLRIADPETAEYIEELLGFREPPTLNASGRFDHGGDGAGTLIDINIENPGVTDYEFLGKTLQLRGFSAKITSKADRHDISDLRFQTFEGSGAGALTVKENAQGNTLIEGGIRWDNMSLSKIGQKFSFEKDALGAITGRLDFTTLANDTRSLNGKGVIGLKNGQLFNVPIFGPLSLPLGTILGKEYSHEQARDASATFVLKDGAVFTKDLLTSTPSTTFVGEGFIDLSENEMDLTMRMNARGLLGLVTLPLAPIRGLFQFRGQGPLKQPVWRSAPFTAPDEGESHPIFKDPPRAQIVPER
jgi:hypothetical protein